MYRDCNNTAPYSQRANLSLLPPSAFPSTQTPTFSLSRCWSLLLLRDEWLLAGVDKSVGVDLFCPQVHRSAVCGLVGDGFHEALQSALETTSKVGGRGMTYDVVENTLVQLPLGRPALPQLVVVVVEALPVGTELLQAGLVDIVDAIRIPVSAYMWWFRNGVLRPRLIAPLHPITQRFAES